MTKIPSRRISKHRRKPLGDAEIHIKDILQKPVLTKRDKEVLLSIYYHRCLTTDQIAEIHFQYDSKGKKNSQSVIIARRRLRKMFDYCLIDRFFIDVGEGMGSSQAHIHLDTLGAKIVAGLLNIPFEELKWRYEMNQARLPYLEHMVKINDFYVRLLRKSRLSIPRHEVPIFVTENHVRYEFKFQGERQVMNPDAYGQYWKGEEGIHFFLELDNGTMSPGVFQKKHGRYTAFYASDEYVQYYENFPLVLVVTTNWERAHQLREAVCKLDSTDIEWYFTSEARVRRDPLGEIWLGKEDEDPVRLI